MLNREDVIGHRIKRIVANISESDHTLNFADFACELDNGIAFRLPWDDASGDLFPIAKVGSAFDTVKFQRNRWWHYKSKLWWARIVDVLVPEDPDLRFPDSSRIALSSGWYISQYSGAPTGILPTIDVMPTMNADDRMVSVWAAAKPWS